MITEQYESALTAMSPLHQSPKNLQISMRWYVNHLKYRPFCNCRTNTQHKDPIPSSLLSQQLEQHKPPHGSENVGPFQLGLVQPSSQNVKKWSELSTGGKVLRTTVRTTNFSVILLGAGLSAILVYALASELFAKNSPTVLYGNACERIRQSPSVNKYLRAPLIFHNNPPSSFRPRHRHRHVNSLLAVDSSGREHLLLSFYVQGSDPSTSFTPSGTSSESRAGQAYEWIATKMASVTELTLDEAVLWTKSTSADALQASRRVFAYLIGEPLHPLPQVPPSPRQGTDKSRASSEESLWSISGIFTRLTGKRRTVVNRRGEASNNWQWTTGEVHADFVKDANGVFVYRYLLIDIPDSKGRNPFRIFVERADGVHDGEVVVRWS